MMHSWQLNQGIGHILFLAGLLIFSAVGCERLSVKQSLSESDESWELVDQDSVTIQFPDRYLGR